MPLLILKKKESIDLPLNLVTTIPHSLPVIEQQPWKHRGLVSSGRDTGVAVNRRISSAGSRLHRRRDIDRCCRLMPNLGRLTGRGRTSISIPSRQPFAIRQLTSPDRISQTLLYPVPDSGAPSGFARSHSSVRSCLRKRRARPTEYRRSSSPATSR